jgi:RNA polymerase sigma factor (TIGR02999 family)
MARQYLARRQDGQTLESAALANEVYLKLIRAGAIRCENRVHFLGLCAQIIRRILVDHARNRGYSKRGGHAERVPLDDVLVGAEARGIEVLALNQALESLAQISQRQARVVELRYFGGLSVEEAAEILGITPCESSVIGKLQRRGYMAYSLGNKTTPNRNGQQFLHAARGIAFYKEGSGIEVVGRGGAVHHP